MILLTISRKQRMLHIIEQLLLHSSQMPTEVRMNLTRAEEQLQQLSEREVDQITDNVFTMPVTQIKLDRNNPENLLHSSYEELERLADGDGISPEFQNAVREMRNYFSIEEQGGFFP
jgi:Glu-tRNA(Gln) amidotransferase subunit E-like FAD-binding protein